MRRPWRKAPGADVTHFVSPGLAPSAPQAGPYHWEPVVPWPPCPVIEVDGVRWMFEGEDPERGGMWRYRRADA